MMNDHAKLKIAYNMVEAKCEQVKCQNTPSIVASPQTTRGNPEVSPVLLLNTDERNQPSSYMVQGRGPVCQALF
jgi:hypothetical protein